uniref:Uncharacterized protein n=1 Tax=Steinernema glaseri TaxID=37863 RepID=A0A1I8AJW6_9BILA
MRTLLYTISPNQRLILESLNGLVEVNMSGASQDMFQMEGLEIRQYILLFHLKKELTMAVDPKADRSSIDRCDYIDGTLDPAEAIRVHSVTQRFKNLNSLSA